MLPKSFVNHSGHELTDTICLIGYDDVISNIWLERAEDMKYLTGGWEHFFGHYNLQDG